MEKIIFMFSNKDQMYFGGFFKKLKTNSTISKVFNPYNNRYFIIDLINRKFSYKICADSKEEIKSHSLNVSFEQDLISWFSNKSSNKDHPLNCPFCLVITFSDKLYTLYTGNSSTFSKFTQALSLVQKSRNNSSIQNKFSQNNNKKPCNPISNQNHNEIEEEEESKVINNNKEFNIEKNNFAKTPINFKFYSRKKFEENLDPKQTVKNKVKKNNFLEKIPIKRASFPSVIIETSIKNPIKNESNFIRLFISFEQYD